MKQRRARSAGFTLIELMVSLIAGLFVAMAVVGLSTQATNTFHEEARTAASEMTLRTAVERLRADLQRAAFMGTGNIQSDPSLAHAPGTAGMPKTGPYTALYRLSSARFFPQGSVPNAPLSAAAGLTPDMIDVSGNFSTTDDYVVRYAEAGGAACGGTRLWLAIDSPAMWRILSQANADSALEAAFQPVTGAQFIARVTDDTGHFQYLPTCVGKAAGVTPTSGGGIASTAYVDLDGTSLPFLTASATKTNGGASGLGVGRLRVNPIQTVRWEIRPINTANAGDAPYAQLVSPAAEGGTTDKYELFREYLDVTGAVVQSELVAEYAVDMRFAFSADRSALTDNPRLLTVYGFTDASNATVADDVTTDVLAQPQRIRSIHFRLTTRSAVADRTDTYSVLQANLQQGAYPTRYCVLASCTSGQVGWARLRSVTSEVATPNLAKFFY